MLDGRPVLGPNINRKYEAELRPLDGIGLSDIEMDSVLTLVLMHVEGLARWQVGLLAIREQSGAVRRRVVDQPGAGAGGADGPAGFPLGSRVGRAAGEYHQSAGDPRHAWISGWSGSWTGSRLIDRSRAGLTTDRHGTLIAMTTIAILGRGQDR